MVSKKERIYLEYLVLHCQNQDRAAWEELIKLYEKRLFYYIKQIVVDENDAQNLLQETWLKAVKSINQIYEPAYLTSWLYRIAHNTTLAYLRKKHIEIGLDSCPEEALPAEAGVESSESFAAERVHEALKSLSLAQREVLTLYFLEDLSMKEISQILDIPVGTVRSRLHYAKCALKTVLEKEI